MSTRSSNSRRTNSKNSPPTLKQYVTVSVAFLVTAIPTVYYSLQLFRQIPASNDEERAKFVPISNEIFLDSPLKDSLWYSQEDSSVVMRFFCNQHVSFVEITGLEGGAIKMVILEIGVDGRTFRGDAICLEHGGSIDEKATLKRWTDNTIVFFAVPHDSPDVPICIRFRPNKIDST